MDMSNQNKIKRVCLQIAFLMEHQSILPDLKELAAELSSQEDYLQGASDALMYLITFLEQKGTNEDRFSDSD